MDYYSKYLKYKNKYLNLQKQSKFAQQFGGDWTCSTCTVINTDDHLECEACGMQKPRVAGIKGEEQRKETEAKYKAIDEQLKRNMGNSTDQVTQKGTVRKEYQGH
jgi:hypothetical protein